MAVVSSVKQKVKAMYISVTSNVAIRKPTVPAAPQP